VQVQVQVLVRRVAFAVLCAGGGIGVLVLIAVAMGSAHQPNSVHQRMGVIAVDGDRVGLRYIACSGERDRSTLADAEPVEAGGTPSRGEVPIPRRRVDVRQSTR
jgi:hypothetical protein